MITKEEFKQRWDSGDDGGGITLKDIARCYVDWGLGQEPFIKPMFSITYEVVKAAGTEDAEEWAEYARMK